MKAVGNIKRFSCSSIVTCNNRKSKYEVKGFTLVELMIVLVIFSVIMGATYGVVNMGQTSFKTGDVQIVVQQEARKAMDKIITELREASSVNLSAEYPFTVWGNKIKYTVVNSQLQRTIQGQSSTVLANDIGNIQFSLSGGNVIYITLTTQRNTVFGHTLRANLTSQLTLRN